MKFCVGKFLSKISTIHGLNYIGDRRNSKFSKFFWISAFILSFLGCSFYFVQVYEKVFIKPDISVKTSFRSFTEFPFPAVTICPQNHFPHKNIKYKENLKKFQGEQNVTYEDRLEMELAFQSCQNGYTDSINTAVNISDINIFEHLSQHQYKTNETIFKYNWNEMSEKTDTLFYRIFTFSGFCSTFNLQDFDEIFTDQIHDDFKVFKNGRKSNWKLSSGYSKNTNHSYPYKNIKGLLSPMDIILLQDHHPIDKACSAYDRGYEIYWNMPNELPSTRYPSLNIYNNNNKSTYVYFNIKSYKASPDLKSYKIEHRKCYFEGEKNLRFFKIYTEKNCKFECLANYTLEECGCVRYFHPRDSSTVVCSSEHLYCTISAEIYIEQAETDEVCQCYPTCDNIEYEVNYKEDVDLFSESVEHELDGVETFMKKVDATTNNQNGSLLKISMLYLFIPKSKVEEQESFASYQIQHFISDFGGLLSLAMGCSILSIVELIYNFIVMRHEGNEEEQEENNDKNVEIENET